MRFWLLVGNVENWERAFKDKKWGVKSLLKADWGRISVGDTLAFYAKSPIYSLSWPSRFLNESECLRTSLKNCRQD